MTIVEDYRGIRRKKCPTVTNMGTIAKGVTDLARDAAYVAVGLGVLGYQRAQVQRVELQNLLLEGLLPGRAPQRRAHAS